MASANHERFETTDSHETNKSPKSNTCKCSRSRISSGNTRDDLVIKCGHVVRQDSAYPVEYFDAGRTSSLKLLCEML